MLKLLSIIIVLSINTHQLKFYGYVYDKQTKEELCGVRVTTNTDTTYTNLNGYFEIEDTNNIKFNLISYEIKDTLICKQ